jgi:hypothetical protein
MKVPENTMFDSDFKPLKKFQNVQYKKKLSKTFINSNENGKFHFFFSSFLINLLGNVFAMFSSDFKSS